MLITRKSPLSGEINTLDINITETQLQAWKDGALIQDVMSNISEDEREFILTGMTEKEWKEIGFGQFDEGLEMDEDDNA